eukprot:TRINITY_DN16876_c0_g3_i1.p1 TRINITY_DN16876_c0_g3~~TRINITY_DN16876_c0_g3_i1.p1  ORF type:complete len:795 (-),score=107.89 TRINITY_DN16876_c0_g3_i1:172-2301(-)
MYHSGLDDPSRKPWNVASPPLRPSSARGAPFRSLSVREARLDLPVTESTSSSSKPSDVSFASHSSASSPRLRLAPCRSLTATTRSWVSPRGTTQLPGASGIRPIKKPVATPSADGSYDVGGQRSTPLHTARSLSTKDARGTGVKLVKSSSEQESSREIDGVISARKIRPSSKLEPGVLVEIGERLFEVDAVIGEGTFGVVWRAKWQGRSVDVAVKEIVCHSREAMNDGVTEGRILRAVGSITQGVGDAIVPTLVAWDTDQISTSQWRVRLAMTHVPGVSLNRFLEKKRRTKTFLAKSCCARFYEACQFARELLAQMAPAFLRISAFAYHRDVNPRNILVDVDAEAPQDASASAARSASTSSGTGAVATVTSSASCEGSATGRCSGRRLRYGLIDFGLAVDSGTWRSGPARLTNGEAAVGSWQVLGVGGDCRYWPVSAWLMLERGPKALAARPQLCLEYKTHLDLHALGVTALQVLAELSPQPPPHDRNGRGSCASGKGGEAEPSSDRCLGGKREDACGTVCEGGDGEALASRGFGGVAETDEMLQRLFAVIGAWKSYWDEATRLWRRLFDAYRRDCGVGSSCNGGETAAASPSPASGRRGGELAAVTTEYAKAAVHARVGEALRGLRDTLRTACEACEAIASAAATHEVESCDVTKLELAREAVPLLTTLLAMIGSGEDSTRSTWRRVLLLAQQRDAPRESSASSIVPA